MSRTKKTPFLLHTFETKGPLFSYDVCWRRVRWQLKRRVGGGVLRYAGLGCRFNINSSTMEAAQSSSTKVTKSQWEKVISKYPVYLQVFVLQNKNPYHIYWLCFHFPLGEPFVMRKEMKEDCFLPSALSTQLILLGGQISAVPAEENRKWDWSIRNKMIGDLCRLQTTLHSLLFSSKWRQAHRGRLPSMAPGPSLSSVLDCTKKLSVLTSPMRHIYRVFKKQSTSYFLTDKHIGHAGH